MNVNVGAGMAGTRRSPSLEETLAVYQEAREHHRLSRQHRNKSKMLMDQFARFKRDLEAMGIEVIIEQPTQITYPPQGGTSDDRSTRG